MRGSRQPNHPGRGSSGRGVRYFHPGGRGGGHAPSSSSISNTPSPPLGELINSFSKDALLEDSKSYTDSARIQDDLPVASYNWFKGKEATVLVPGNPPRWTPPLVGRSLKQDSGLYFRDKNAAMYPAHLMESTVLAALAAEPSIKLDVDMVVDVSSLGNLLRFVMGMDKSFRVLAQVVDGTVFLVRRENSPTETIDDIKGYGHTFPEAYTTWDKDMMGSITNHRITKYAFGGLRVMVRFEADAYLAGDKGVRDGKRTTPTLEDDIDKLMPTLEMSSNTATPSSTAPLAIRPASATPIPQSQLLEIKTRGHWKKGLEDTMAQEFPKLYFAQIPNFVAAYHHNGRFEAGMEIQSVKPRIKAWEKKIKAELACFAALLHEVAKVVKGSEDGKVELVRTGMGELEVREWGGDVGDVVSEDTKMLWRDGKGSEAVGEPKDGDEVDSGAL